MTAHSDTTLRKSRRRCARNVPGANGTSTCSAAGSFLDLVNGSLRKRSALNDFAAYWDTMPPVNVASAMVEGARLRLRRPVSSLRACLGCFWSIKTTAATRLRTLPDACATLSIESGHSKALECFLVGPRQTPDERVPAAE